MKDDASLHQVPGGRGFGDPARWMVVDDNESLLEWVASLLETVGAAEVSRFNSAAAALAAFAAAPQEFEFVVTDLEMPGMNGNELCRRLLEISPGLKVLLATGSTTITEREAVRCGFCGLLPKPFPIERLSAALAAAGILDGDAGHAHPFVARAWSHAAPVACRADSSVETGFLSRLAPQT